MKEATNIEAMMAELNRSIVVGRRTLCEMHDSGDYSFRTRDGSVVEIPEEQIDKIWNECTDQERIRLRLPIFVSTDTSSETGAWKVEGAIEAPFVSRLLKKPLYRNDLVRLYHPDLKRLRAEIPDAIMIIFTP